MRYQDENDNEEEEDESDSDNDKKYESFKQFNKRTMTK